MAFQLATITVEPETGERRYAPRRTLSLGALASTDPASWRVVIHDLSQTGLRIQTAAQLQTGDTVKVDLPGPLSVAARVIWSDEGLYGCEFLEPITRGAVSAALLRSPADSVPATTPVRMADLAWEQVPDLPRPTGDGAAMGAMLAMLLVVVIFVYSLMALPFSAQQW